MSTRGGGTAHNARADHFRRLLRQELPWAKERMAVARNRPGESGGLEVGVIRRSEPLRVRLGDADHDYADADELLAAGWRLSGWH